MKWRPLVLVALFGLLVLAILPAQAALVTPKVLTGDPDCGTVESSAPFSFKIEPVTNGTFTDPGPGGAQITLAITPGTGFSRPTLAFQIAGGAARDVILDGNNANWYDYDEFGGDPVSSDSGLRTPNGNMTRVWFCYDQVLPDVISGTKVDDANASGTRDEGELGVEGWTIYLFGSKFVETTVTDASGEYRFEDPLPGSYVVCEAATGPGGGWSQSAPLGPENDVCDPLEIEGELGSGGYAVAYEGGSVTGLDFLNFQGGRALFCEDPESVGEGTTGTFTRIDDPADPDDCAVEKNARMATEGTEGEIIVFIPRGLGSSDYRGVLTFIKQFDDPNLLVLQYDPDDDGEATFRDVPACQDATFDVDGNLITATLPVGDDTWCFASVEGRASGGGSWRVTWQVFGTADPRFG